MFGIGKKKRPVLTKTTCNNLEDLRLALEVMSGKRIRFVHFDFNSERGQVKIGEERNDISCIFYNSSFLFTLKPSLETGFEPSLESGIQSPVEYFANCEIRSSMCVKRIDDKGGTSWVGSSMMDRCEETLHPEN